MNRKGKTFLLINIFILLINFAGCAKPKTVDDYENTTAQWLREQLADSPFEPSLEDLRLTDSLMSENARIHNNAVKTVLAMDAVDVFRIIYIWQIRSENEKFALEFVELPYSGDRWNVKVGGKFVRKIDNKKYEQYYESFIKPILYRIGNDADETWATLLVDPNVQVRYFTMNSLWELKLDSDVIINALIESLQHPVREFSCDPDSSSKQAGYISTLPPEKVVDPLIDLMAKKDVKSQYSVDAGRALLMMDKIEDYEAILRISELMQDERLEVQKKAIKIIDKFGPFDDHIMNLLIDILAGPFKHNYVQSYASQALLKYEMRAIDAVPLVVRLIEVEPHRVNHIRLLGGFGADVKHHLPLLRLLLGHEYERVRDAAKDAIAKIETDVD